MSFGWDEAPNSIREQAQGIAVTLNDYFGESLLGVYVHGSLAFGCCNPRQSDLDVLAVTERPTPAELRLPLLRQLVGCSGAPLPLEMSVVVQPDVTPWIHPTPYDLHISEMHRAAVEAGQPLAPGLDPDLAAHVTVTRHCGITLAGSTPAVTLPPVPWEDYLDSILADFDDCVARLTETYAVLNMTRVWATLATGEIYSKDSSAEWALPRLPEDLRGILTRALDAYRHGDRQNFAADPRLPDYKRFMVDIVESLHPRISLRNTVATDDFP